MSSKLAFLSTGLILVTAATPLVAYCEVYLTEEQALKSMFPGETFTRKDFELKPDEVQKIENSSDERVRSTHVKAWVSTNKDIMFVDQVLGKHEFITMVVGISHDGKVKGIDILEYRESYGQQVKTTAWREQFVGKDKYATLKVGRDIKNISGATLSSVHVTGGVKRLVQTYDCIRARI